MDIDIAPTKMVIVRKVPVELWRQLKMRAAADYTTTQATVIKAIEQYLNSHAA